MLSLCYISSLCKTIYWFASASFKRPLLSVDVSVCDSVILSATGYVTAQWQAANTLRNMHNVYKTQIMTLGMFNSVIYSDQMYAKIGINIHFTSHMRFLFQQTPPAFGDFVPRPPRGDSPLDPTGGLLSPDPLCMESKKLLKLNYDPTHSCLTPPSPVRGVPVRIMPYPSGTGN